MTKIENGGLVRHGINADPGEFAHGLDLVQGVFHRRIAEVVKELHAVNTQHDGQRIWLAATQGFAVVTGNRAFKLFPRQQSVHLC